MRKGPDGKTIRPDSPQRDGATRKVAKRSILDRMAAADDDDPEATRLAGDSGRTAPPPPRSQSPDATVYSDGPSGPARRSDAPTSSPDRPGPTEPAVRGADVPKQDGASDAPAEEETAAPAQAPSSERASVSRDPNVTQVYRPRATAASGTPEADVGDGGGGGSRIGTIDDPVVGWLVVIEGPGRGAALPIGYGNNRVGRSATEDIILDFGDGQISRENHAIITYDGKHRRFYIQQGAGRNLTHVDDELVMVPVEMKGGETVSMGDTKVRFVPFCGADFDWYDA